MSIKSTIKTYLTNKKINNVLDSYKFNEACEIFSKVFNVYADTFKTAGDIAKDPEKLKETIKSIHKSNKEQISNIAIALVDAYETVKDNGEAIVHDVKDKEQIKSLAGKFNAIIDKIESL